MPDADWNKGRSDVYLLTDIIEFMLSFRPTAL